MEDERLIRLAQEHGYVTAAHLERVREEQRQLSDRGIERSVWFLLQDLGIVSAAQVKSLSKYISSTNVRALEVDGYTIQGRLGSGGMGDVFRATDASGNHGAVKLLSSKLLRSTEHIRRFNREARTTLRLRHPHITRSISAGDIDGQCYLIMELIEGPSLKTRIAEQGRLLEPDALVLLWQMAHALNYAWKHGVLHRDVKPANIMLGTPRSTIAEPFCAKLCDFGLAKVTEDSGEADVSHGGLTGSGMALGTPHYMAPEQASGEIDLDQRADIYSLGASLYHALLGQTMYNGRSSTVIMYKQVTEDVDLLPLQALKLNPRFDTLLGRMLDRRRGKRIASWDMILAELKDIAPALVQLQEKALELSLPLSSTTHARHPSAKSTAPSHSRASLTPALAPRTGRTEPTKPPKVSRSWIIAGASVILAAGITVALVGHRGHSLSASPTTLATALASARNKTIDLEPGDYIGPWHFGVAHSGLTLRAAGPGVRLMSNGNQAAVRLDPGLRNAHVIGMTIQGAGGAAIESLLGSELTLDDVEIDGRMVLNGGSITGRRVHVAQGVKIENQGTLTLEDAFLHGAQPFIIQAGAMTLHRCRIGGGGPGTTLGNIQSGSITLDAVDAIGINGTATGLVMGPTVQARLTDVTITNIATGIFADRSILAVVDGLTINASSVGIDWHGELDSAWRWNNMAIAAPSPVHGAIELAVGPGARRERMDSNAPIQTR